MKKNRGSYILFLYNKNQINIDIGSLNNLFFSPGIYLYIGSALSPGGLAKRIQRHLQKTKKIFWHIDYLTTNNSFSIKAYFEIYSEMKVECILGNIIRESFNKEEIIEYKDFGSSDCRCNSHLFQINKNLDEIILILRPKIQKYKFKLVEIKE
ncbi:MAG TPA: GIY-YIG nuclease family protein [Candidatus Bathyarchaeia archaeon]|nr:GIY-YIG nuclease family protein [Candidatus Bathyarchaeia archaeon]